MSLEDRLQKLETQHKNLDADVHGLARVCADIKNIALTNQHDIARLNANITALTTATHAGFKKSDEQHNDFVTETRERFDKVDKRLETMDEQHNNFAKETREHFETMENKHNDFVEDTRDRFDKIDSRFDKMDSRFDQLELLMRQYFSNN